MDYWKSLEYSNEHASTLLSYRTRSFNNYLKFILIYDEHNALVGASNMSDIIWDGTLWHFNDIENFNREKAIERDTDHGINDAVYLSHNKFAVVGDVGNVEIFELVETENEEQSREIHSLQSATQHDDVVLTVSAFHDKEKIVTGGLDYCIKVWDVENLLATYSYSYAHTSNICGVDVKPMCNFTFISVSEDEALLWDIRQPTPAHILYKTVYEEYINGRSLSTVTWKSDSNYIALGTNEDIKIIDVRQLADPTYAVYCGENVTNLLFHPDIEKKQLLACSTPKSMRIYNADCEIIYHNTRDSFIGGITWYKDNLFICDWDGEVLKQSISSLDY